MDSKQRAETFRALHIPGDPVVLPNAWDVATARLIEQAGARAIATTSAAICWSLGVPDGDRLGRDEAVTVITRIASAVDVPVTADIEAGYGESAVEVGETIRAVIGAGAVGVNIEDARADGLLPTNEAAARIAAARAAADAAGIPLYINARTDPFLRQAGDPADRLPEALRRGQAYLEAGASGIFVPGVQDLAVIRSLTSGIPAPVNILAGPSAPTVTQLAQAGVGRISTGSSLAGAVLASLRTLATAVLGDGDFAVLAGGISHAEMNGLVGD